LGNSGRPSGRPTKCTPKAIVDAERIQSLGATDIITAEYIGVSTSCFYEWIQKGERDPDSVYGHFAEAIKKGRSQSGIINLQAVQAAVRKGQWTAAAWLLERRHGYRNTPEAIQQLQPQPIDVTTEAGAEAALEILNSLPVTVLAKMDPRRLSAAANYHHEEE